jgi:hypothetical protein
VSWQETRGAAVATAVRRSAHSDDAKHRSHDASQVRAPRFPKWVPLAVAGALVVLVVGGAAAARMASSGNNPTTPSSHSTAKSGDKNQSRSDATTGLPTAPTTRTVTYLASSKCVHPSEFANCSGLATEELVCPGGKCTIGIGFGPLLSARRLAVWKSDKVVFDFTAGQPTLSHRATMPSPGGGGCHDRVVTISGQRGADGSYSLRFQIVYYVNDNGSCISSPVTYDGTLAAPKT